MSYFEIAILFYYDFSLILKIIFLKYFKILISRGFRLVGRLFYLEQESVQLFSNSVSVVYGQCWNVVCYSSAVQYLRGHLKLPGLLNLGHREQPVVLASEVRI